MTRSEGRNRSIWAALHGRSGAFAAVAAVSLALGLAEAGFLVLITKVGFAVSEGASVVHLPAIGDASVGIATLIGLTMVALRVLLGVANAWQGSKLVSTYTAEMRLQLADAWLHASYPAKQENADGELQELLVGFTQRGSALISYLTTTVTSAFNLAALLGLAVFVDPLASLMVIGAVFVLGAVIRPLRAAVRRAGKTSAQSNVKYATALAEISQLAVEIHTFDITPAVRQSIATVIEEQARVNRRVSFLTQLVPAVYTGVAYCAVLGAVAVVASVDGADLGSVGAVLLLMLRSLAYGQALQGSITGAASVAPFVHELEDRQHHLLSSARLGSQTMTEVEPIIEIDDVTFAYGDNAPAVLEHSFNVSKGEFVGLVGPSGSGKSTLVQLILGLRSPQHGSVRLGGIDVADISPTDLRDRVAFVPQRPRLIRGSVSENVRFFRSGISDAEVERACRMASLHDDIVSWPGGYSRQCGSGGGWMSGGQQQRIVLARALAGRPDVLVLDEPTSALDPPSEAAIRATLASLRGSLAVVVVAHRLSTLDVCDRLVVIQDGKITANGPAEDIKKNGYFSEMIRLAGLA